IAGDVLPRIFNAFEQGERNINHRFGGLGLGLAISRTLVDLHSGHIEAASDGEGTGATFTVVLPTISREAPAGPDADTGSPQAIRVLLVEDHRDTREVMRMFLEQRGYQVRVAESMEAAIRQAAMPFDLLISDIGLPDGSGLDLIRTLASRGPVRGIAVSGYGMEEDIRRSIEAGFAEHLTKPVKPARLEEAIRALTR
ncbi:MAG: response regulator, partial [Bacteroidota bacterium]